MSDRTAISWTDATWNPVTGCTKVSPGCAHCYIERTPAFRMTKQRFERGRIPVRLHHDRLDQPLHWRKPRRVFVVSMGDLFHPDVPDEFIDRVFAVMALTPWHTYQVLTKRPERMRAYCGLNTEPVMTPNRVALAIGEVSRLDGGRTFMRAVRQEAIKSGSGRGYIDSGDFGARWPLPNVWLGVTAENQRMADERIPLLLETPAAVRFVSCEPLLGPLNLWRPLDIYSHDGTPCCTERTGWHRTGLPGLPHGHQPRLDWVIAGGESGGPEKRRLVERYPPAGEMTTLERQLYRGTGWRPKPHALEWVRDLRDQCQAAGVPFFWKQWEPKAGQGTLLDGREWREMPQREAVVT